MGFMSRTVGAAATVLMLASTAALAQSAPPEVVKELAPTGKLRAAINAGNVVLVQKDAAGGAPRGVTVALANELAHRLGVPADLIVYDTAGKVTDAAETNAWDIGFVAIEPARAKVMAFTAPYVIIVGTYMVRADSALKNVGDVDRDGTRIAVARGSAYDLYLSRTLKHASLVRYPSPLEAFAGFIADKRDAAAGVRQFLVAAAKTHPDMRVMADHFQEIREAMTTPLGRDAGLRYLKSFVEEMKASGFVRKALNQGGQADAVVAPANGD
jgi:polar amino acid transport system substrate-binding protein